MVEYCGNKMTAFILGQTMFRLIEGEYLLLFSHYGGKIFQVNTEQLLFCFPNELKNPLHSQLHLQYLGYSAPEVPHGAVSKTRGRRQIKPYLFLCVPCTCREGSEARLTSLNLPLDPTIFRPLFLGRVQMKLRNLTLIF